LAGQGAVKGLSAVAHPVEDALSDIGKKAVQTLKDAGIPLDAAQTTGSALLHRVKASLSDNPITAGGQSAFSQMQQAAYNKAVAKTMGEDATAITPDVIQSAKDRIGKVYDSVADRTGIHVTPDYQQGFQDILGDARMQLNDQQYAILDRNVNDIMNKANMNGGFINGDQYKNIKQALDGISKSPDTQVGEFARDLRDYVNKGLSDTANIMGDTQAVQDLKTANRQWGNMRKVEDVTIGKNAEGDVSPARLYSSLGAKNKRYSFYQDDPQLAELAQAGKLILPNQVPNSGTVARMMAQGLLSAGTPAAITGAATGLYQGDWGSALKGAVAGAALPKVVQYGMNNPRFVQYLAEGLPNNNIRNLLNVPQAIGAQRIPLSLISAQKQSQQ
jgi:hypothetical protein